MKRLSEGDLKEHIRVLHEQAGYPSLAETASATGYGWETIRSVFDGKNMRRAATVITILDFLHARKKWKEGRDDPETR